MGDDTYTAVESIPSAQLSINQPSLTRLLSAAAAAWAGIMKTALEQVSLTLTFTFVFIVASRLTADSAYISEVD